MSLYFNSQDGQPPGDPLYDGSQDMSLFRSFGTVFGMGRYLEVGVVLGSFCLSLAGLWFGLRASEHIHPAVPAEISCDPDTLKQVTNERNELQTIAASIQASAQEGTQKTSQGAGKGASKSSKSYKKYSKNTNTNLKK